LSTIQEVNNSTVEEIIRNEKDIAETKGTELEESRNRQRNVTLETATTINS
jgi:hypothetical protein